MLIGFIWFGNCSPNGPVRCDETSVPSALIVAVISPWIFGRLKVVAPALGLSDFTDCTGPLLDVVEIHMKIHPIEVYFHGSPYRSRRNYGEWLDTKRDK